MKNSPRATVENTEIAPKVLLVEDSPVIQKVYATFLAELGCRVDIVDKGLEALRRVKSTAYDGIVLDLGLPDVRGQFVLLTIRYLEHQSGGHIPIVVASAGAGETTLQECLRQGADRVFSKEMLSEVDQWPAIGRLFGAREGVESWTK